MLVVAISASNIKHAREKSTSLTVCRLIAELVSNDFPGQSETAIIPLVDYELTPCIGCGNCFTGEICLHDDDFNRIFSKIKKADALFIVSAHYAPVPAKLCMLLEKIEQLAFLKRFNNESYRSPLFRKPVGIIGHGGASGNLHEYYRTPVIDSIWNALSYPVEMNIVGVDDQQPRGVTFPVKRVSKANDSIFPVQEYDFEDIKRRISPLVKKVMIEAKGNKVTES